MYARSNPDKHNALMAEICKESGMYVLVYLCLSVYFEITPALQRETSEHALNVQLEHRVD
jgi:hypothetical protein